MNDFDNKQICSYKDIDRFGFTCDVCGRKVNGCHYINGMSFCEKCYQETFGKDNQQNEIQQLKQQLAEKDKEIAHLKEKDNYHLRYELAGADETITNLKEQLAEKDKEIEKLKITKNNAIECADLFKVALSVRQKDLAIQELEKVKIELKNKICMVKNEEHCYSQRFISWYEMCDQINKQIKELKGEKDVED